MKTPLPKHGGRRYTVLMEKKNLPTEFLRRMEAQLGVEYPAFLKSYGLPPKRGLRVNTLKTGVEEFRRISPFPLAETGILPEGLLLAEETPGIGNHPYHLAGLFYLQEPSAMAAIAAAEVRPGMRVLDLCAAPGGKSGGIAARLSGEGFLLANEIVPNRARTLASTLERLGVANAAVTCAKPEAIAEAFPDYFDVTLVDAPCSGEGMFRKDPVAVQEWSASNVGLCSERQKEILHNIWDALRPGRILIYSTCTYNTDENELIADYIQNRLGATPLPVKTYPEWGIHKELTGTVPCYRFMPHVTKGEGLFMTVFRKSESEDIIPRERLQNRMYVLFPIISDHGSETMKSSFSVLTQIRYSHFRQNIQKTCPCSSPGQTLYMQEFLWLTPKGKTIFPNMH